MTKHHHILPQMFVVSGISFANTRIPQWLFSERHGQAIQWFCFIITSVLFNNSKDSSALSEDYNKIIISLFLISVNELLLLFQDLFSGQWLCYWWLLTSTAHKKAKHSFPVKHLQLNYMQRKAQYLKLKRFFRQWRFIWVVCWQAPITKQSPKCASDPLLSIWTMILDHF